MLKKYSLFVVVFLSLLGCDSGDYNSDATSPNKQIVSIKLAEKTKSRGLGTYKKNDTTVPINDFFAIWIEDQNKLKIIQTPTELTDDEKNRLEEGENDFLVLVNKETPDHEVWEWYPYIVTELSFKSKEINSDNLKSFYIKAYGIEEANYTDNLNSYPNNDNSFRIVDYANDKLIIEYSGRDDIMEDNHSWSIKIN